MEDIFETLANALRPIDPNNPFGIDYSDYEDCIVLANYSESVKVKVQKSGAVMFISKNHILYKSLEVGEVIKCNKNYYNDLNK